MTSSPGGRCGPFHSTILGCRMRNPSAAASIARPFEKAALNSARWRPEAKAAWSDDHVSSPTKRNDAGLLVSAASRLGASIPSAVASSVTVVRSASVTEQRAELQFLGGEVHVAWRVEIERRIHVDVSRPEPHPRVDCACPMFVAKGRTERLEECSRHLRARRAGDQLQSKYPVERLNVLGEKHLRRVVVYDGAGDRPCHSTRLSRADPPSSKNRDAEPLAIPSFA